MDRVEKRLRVDILRVGSKPVDVKLIRKREHVEGRLFALRNIASNAINDFIMHEYDNVR